MTLGRIGLFRRLVRLSTGLVALAERIRPKYETGSPIHLAGVLLFWSAPLKQDIRDFAAAILVDSEGRLLLQHRDDIPGIVHPGKIALFGGRREPAETPLECIMREVAEEIGYQGSAADFEFFASLNGADPERIARRLCGEVFVARNIPSSDLVVSEGKLVVAHPSELDEFRSEMTPLTLVALEAFLKGSNPPA